MTTARATLIVLSAVCLLAGTTLAQAPASQPASAPAGKVLQYVPADCAAFVVVNSVKGMGAKVDALVKSFTPGEEAGQSALDMIKAQAGLGELDAINGLAVVILDPKAYNVTLKAVFSGERTAADRAATSPTVFIMPGTDAEKMFTGRTVTKEEDFVKVAQNDEVLYGKVVDGFLVLGENKKSVTAVVGTAKPVTGALSPAFQDMLVRNDVVAYANMKVLAPALDALIADALLTKVDEMAGAASDPAAVMSDLLIAYREILAQMDGIMLGVRLDKPGINVDARLAFLPDSAMGKAVAISKAVAGDYLDRLPNMPYVLAFGGLNQPKTPKELMEKQINRMLAGPPLKDLKDETKKKVRELCFAANDQVTGFQFYFGNITTGRGKIGAALVYQAESAAKLKGLLADAIPIVNEILAASGEPDLKAINLKYQQGAEPLGDNKLADAIVIDFPRDKLSEKEITEMKAVLGEDKLNILVGAADEKTLVLTIGGGKSFFQEALKTAADKSGRISKDPMSEKSLSVLPKERSGLLLINVTNIVKLFTEVAIATGETQHNFNVGPTSPIAAAAVLDKSDVALTLHIPTQTLVELFQSVMALWTAEMGKAMGGGAAPVAPVVP